MDSVCSRKSKWKTLSFVYLSKKVRFEHNLFQNVLLNKMITCIDKRCADCSSHISVASETDFLSPWSIYKHLSRICNHDGGHSVKVRITQNNL